MVESVQNHNLLKSESRTDKVSKRGKRGHYKKHAKSESCGSKGFCSESIENSGLLMSKVPEIHSKRRITPFAQTQSNISDASEQKNDDVPQLKCEESGCDQVFGSKKSLRNHI